MSRLGCWFVGCFLVCSAWLLERPAWAASEAPASVTLTAGETLLSDLGNYRVGWQSYGQEPVLLPVGWTGRQDERSGAAYESGTWIQGRPVIFMHCPWRVPTGRTWVDYPITLPAITPIELSFGVAMSAGAAVSPDGDGVTFSCCVIADGAEHELLRVHSKKAEWLDQRFDLAAYAGRSIVVRLQVEPGPANNPNFDHSYFSEPKLVIGDAQQTHAEELQGIVATRAYRATAAANLLAASNDPKHGITPSNLLPGRNALLPTEDAWQFRYQGEDCQVVYTYRPKTGTLEDFVVQVDEGPEILPMANGGVTAAIVADGQTREIRLSGGQPSRVAVEGDTLSVLWQYDTAGRPIQIAWQFRIVGKAMVIDARCEEPLVRQFSLGTLGPVAIRRRVAIPYLLGDAVYLPAERLFVNRYLDWTVSQSSICPQGEASYNQKTDQTRNLLVERGFVAVSPNLAEVLPNLPSPASPYRDVLGPRIMLDIWGHRDAKYASDAENLRTLKDHGVDHVAIIQHDWQHFGYDVKLPDHVPANPQFGGDEGLIAFGQAARDCGYLWSLHENYIDMYPDAPSFDATARAMNPDGTPCLGWFNAGTNMQAFAIKCTRGLDFARQNAPEAHRRYGTTAAYLDVHTCIPPWTALDHEAGQPMAAMAQARMKYDTELFQYMRDTHGGPLLGEGANQFYWAGRCDGVEAQVPGGEDHTPLVDFDLLKIHPQMVNHGMGYYARWFRGGYGHRMGRDAGTMEQIDKYRAQELAYGHAGFVGDAQVFNLQWVVREHHLMHPIQRLYGTAQPVEICYEVDGQLVTASAAVAVGDTSRQRIRYESGLTLWINWRPEPWTVEGHVLPQWGFLAMGPETCVATSLHGDRVADYAECPEFVFADARTSIAMPYREDRKITAQPPTPDEFPEADFSLRLNRPGTWIDFGPLATDGSAKVNREADRLVVFPYPHDKNFRVSLDLQALAPTADPARVVVRALAAGTQEDRGAVPLERDGSRVILAVGTPGVGRYVITWK